MDPRAKLMQIYGGPMLARCLGIVAELGVADHVATGPKTSDELAALTGAHAQNLFRVMRFLAADGVFRQDAHGLWHQTDTSEPLCSDVEGSLRDVVRCRWQDVMWRSYQEMPQTVRTGEPAFDLVYGAPFFEYLQTHPDVGAAFDAAMAGSSDRENICAVKAYDFSGVTRVMDVAGGRGGFLAQILLANAHLKGFLFEQESVLADPSFLHAAGVIDQCELIAGDFFAYIPARADIYTLKRILHDWHDDNAVRILKNVAAAMTSHSKVLVVDAVIQLGNDPDSNKGMDVGMMTLLEGRERTEEDFRQIFTDAGLRLTRIIPTAQPSTMSIVEGMKA